jgi:hypothetical protein
MIPPTHLSRLAWVRKKIIVRKDGDDWIWVCRCDVWGWWRNWDRVMHHATSHFGHCYLTKDVHI